MKTLVLRNSIKVLLINDKNELLLLHADDPKTTSIDGIYHGPFWFPVGGKMEPEETTQEAALREIYEETGIKKNDIELGPIVWYGEFDLVLIGNPTRIREQFIVAKTKKNIVNFSGLTTWEKAVVKKAEWFTIEKIRKSTEVIFPVLLPHYLPDILTGKYPKKPIKIDLGKQPT